MVTPLTMRATGRRARWSKKWSLSKTTTGSVGSSVINAATAAEAPRPASTQPSRATTRTGCSKIGSETIS